MRPARVAVTGAGGFIGRALVSRLAAVGVGLRLHAGPPGAPGPDDAARFDITDASAVEAFVQGVECVVHLAGPPDIRASVAAPWACLHAHVTGTALVAAAAARGGAALVYVSSAAARGVAGLGPTPPYVAAKRAAEAIVRAYADVVPALIVRPANVYGPGAHPDTLIPELCRSAAAGEPVRPRVPAARVDPVHVDDVAAALMAAVERVRALPTAACLEIGSGRDLSAGEIAALVTRLAFGVADPAAGTHAGPIEAAALEARVALSWSPVVTLEAGVRALLSGSEIEPGRSRFDAREGSDSACGY